MYLAGRSLETSGRLMELNTKDGRLHVSYSDRLVTLVREVRMLLQRGFAVPAKIQHVAQVAEKFKMHANILKQVRRTTSETSRQLITSRLTISLLCCPYLFAVDCSSHSHLAGYNHFIHVVHKFCCNILSCEIELHIKLLKHSLFLL